MVVIHNNKTVMQAQTVARVLDIAPAGGRYATGSYSLRLSDGDVGTLYGGTF